MLRFIRDILEQAGLSVFVTGDPEEVSQLIGKHRPDLVLLDLMLPGKDGIQLMQEIPEMRELVVIFISAYGREETVTQALENGAADYIVKPFSPIGIGGARQGGDAGARRTDQPHCRGGPGHRPPATPGDCGRGRGRADRQRV